MTCETARLLLNFTGADLAADDAAALAEHLAGCPACTAHSSRTTAADAAIATAMKAVPAPVGLRDALLTQAIVQRNALWRTRWLGRTTAAAAAVLTLALGYGLLTNLTRPAIDAEMLLAQFDAGQRSPTGSFEEWRNAEGLPPLPVDFDLNLLSFTGRLSLAGRSLPAARFDAGPGRTAVVYFVRNSTLNAAGCTDAVTSQGSVRVHRTGRWTIIIIHTGNSLAPFLHPRGGAA